MLLLAGGFILGAQNLYELVTHGNLTPSSSLRRFRLSHPAVVGFRDRENFALPIHVLPPAVNHVKFSKNNAVIFTGESPGIAMGMLLEVSSIVNPLFC